MKPVSVGQSLWLLVALQVAVSASSLIVEIVAGRMLAPYVGMSLYTWTSVIAVVLFGFSVGHWWGGRVAEKSPDSAIVHTGWILLAAAVSTAVAVFGLHQIAGGLLQVVESPVWAIVLLTFSIFFLPSLFAGVPAPVLTQLAVEENREMSGRTLGTMFAAGAIGAIAGTLLAGFAFIPWLGTALTLAAVTVVYAVSGLLMVAFGKGLRASLLAVVVGVVAILLSGISASRASPCTQESQYFCIRVLDVSASTDMPVKRLILDHLSHGTSARDVPRVMFSEFTAMLDEIARQRMGREFSAFFIGGGTYSVPRAWADRKTGPITVAELDPAVTKIARDEFWLDDSEMTILHEDARRVLRDRSETYDVIVGDAFSDIAIPVHLVTREFFELVSERLNADGVFLMNVVDFPERMHALAAIFVTLESVFPQVEVWTKATPPVTGEQRVFVLAASSSRTPFSTITVPAPGLTRFSALDESFNSSVLRPRAEIVLTDDHAPIDRLLFKGWF